MRSESCDGGSLTPLAVMVLGLVLERPMHPYEMVQVLLERKEDRLAKIRPGSLYHTVDRLVRDQLLAVHGTVREGNRPERTVYEVTDAGRGAFASSIAGMLAGSRQEFPELYLGLAEAHGLPRAQVIEMLQQRVASLRAEIDELDVSVACATSQGSHEIFMLDVGCRRATLVAQADWVADLVDRLADGSLPWLDDDPPTLPEYLICNSKGNS